jgi:hypothetical protein
MVARQVQAFKKAQKERAAMAGAGTDKAES